MKNQSLKILFSVFTFAMIFSSCTPITENEMKKWDVNQNTASNLKAKYPAYSKFIDSSLETLKTEWINAEKETSEEKKAEKLSEINSNFQGGLIGSLSALDYKVKDVKKKQDKLSNIRMAASKKYAARSALTRSQEYLNSALEIMNRPITSSEAGKNNIKEASGILIRTNSNLSSAIKNASPKKKKKKKKKKK